MQGMLQYTWLVQFAIFNSQFSLYTMKILNDNTPTGELNDVKIGDSISNGIGTFGEVEAVNFESGDGFWQYTFALVGGGFIQVKKTIQTC